MTEVSAVIERLAAQLGVRTDEVTVGDVVALASERLTQLTEKLDLMTSTLGQIRTELEDAQHAAEHAADEVARLAEQTKGAGDGSCDRSADVADTDDRGVA